MNELIPNTFTIFDDEHKSEIDKLDIGDNNYTEAFEIDIKTVFINQYERFPRLLNASVFLKEIN
jgi:hypothetical protein